MSDASADLSQPADSLSLPVPSRLLLCCDPTCVLGNVTLRLELTLGVLDGCAGRCCPGWFVIGRRCTFCVGVAADSCLNAAMRSIVDRDLVSILGDLRA